jgi:hypothetical protein
MYPVFSAVPSGITKDGDGTVRPSQEGDGRIGRPGTEHSPSPAVNCRHPWIFLSVHNIHIKLITIILTLKQGPLASVLSIQCLIPLIKSCCIHDFRHSDACMTSSAKRLRRSLLHVYLDRESQHRLMPCMRMKTCMKMVVVSGYASGPG